MKTGNRAFVVLAVFTLLVTFCRAQDSVLSAAGQATQSVADIRLEVSPSHTDGIYRHGESIKWSVTIPDIKNNPVENVHYRIMRDAGQVLQQGTVVFKNGRGEVEFVADKPGTLLLEVNAGGKEKTNQQVFAGAIVDPDKIMRSAPRPADFDAFWDRQLAELAKVPSNPELTATTNNQKGVSRWLINMDMPHGAKMRGQLARPTTGEKFPAIIVFQWAGVYGLESWSVNNHAANGWLALNVMAHDLPIDQTPEFYEKQKAGPLKDYQMIGCGDREKSYFLRMFLACSRAVDYLASRPDWDGRTLVVTGASQGGLQSIVAAALNPKVTAMIVIVPAGCDATASLADRGVPWPYWGEWLPDEKRDAALRTGVYFDGINFAPRVKCPSLVGFGLLDRTATPAGVFLMTNQLGGPVEKLLMPAADHKGDHAAYNSRSKEWLEALKAGKPLLSVSTHQPEPVDEVDPFIGTVTTHPSSPGHGLGKTIPGPCTPYGLVQLGPDTIIGGDNGIGWYGDFGNLQVMPQVGEMVLDREAAKPYMLRTSRPK